MSDTSSRPSDESPQRDETALTPTSRTTLQRLRANLETTDRVLARSERERHVQFFRDHPQFFVHLLSRFHPLSEMLINQYADRWKYDGLSGNDSLPWSKALIDQYADR